jgi:hypothetical protein
MLEARSWLGPISLLDVTNDGTMISESDADEGMRKATKQWVVVYTRFTQSVVLINKLVTIMVAIRKLILCCHLLATHPRSLMDLERFWCLGDTRAAEKFDFNILMEMIDSHKASYEDSNTPKKQPTHL